MVKKIIVIITICSLISSCAAYRRGIRSIISEETIKSTNATINRKAIPRMWGMFDERLELPNMSLEIYLFNKKHTHHIFWFLFIPFYF